MKVFLAGATGVLGRRLVPLLIERGHEIVGLARSSEKAEQLASQGATPCEASLFDTVALTRGGEGCEVFVHAATAIPTASRRPPGAWEENDRIRREGASALAAAAAAVGAKGYVQQSVVWVAAPEDGGPFDEDSPVCEHPLMQSAIDSERIAAASGAEFGFETTVLRCGWFYAAEATHTKMIADALRKRMLPIIGRGEAWWCCLHADDAAAAFVAAIENPLPGTWHVVDNEPVQVGDLFNEFARLLGAKPPRHMPKWLVQILASKEDVEFLTRSTQTTAERFRRDFAWEPNYPSYREGLRQIVEAWKTE